MLEYYHADRLNFVATGTPNRLEYDQGFFVKLGDGAADVKPIAHLYKTQVYALAALPRRAAGDARPPLDDRHLLAAAVAGGVLLLAAPSTRWTSCLYGKNNDVPIEEVAAAAGLTVEQVERVYRDIEQKRRTTQYLHLPPELAAPVPEIH